MKRINKEEVSDHERNLVEHFFHEHRRLVRKLAGDEEGIAWEALLAAVKCWNASKGGFKPYAVVAIKHAMAKAANRDKIIYVPKSPSKSRKRLRDCINYDDVLTIDASPDDDGPGAGACIPVSRVRSPETTARCHEIVQIVRESLSPQ